jgi:hypothetical protein
VGFIALKWVSDMGPRTTDECGIFNSFGSMITNDARCTREIKRSIAMEKAAFKRRRLFDSKLELNLRNKLVKC